MPSLKSIVPWLDHTLRTREVTDWPGAHNGLQIENSGNITRVVAAVDACEAVLIQAASQPGTLLVVHHGLFWGSVQPVAGSVYRKYKAAFDGDLAVYAAHLPLDVHPTLGNNVLFAKALGFKKCTPFFFEKGQYIGVQTRAALSLAELSRRIEYVLGSSPHLAPGRSARTARIGIVTGGAGAEVARAASEGVDTFITGEGPQHSYTLAEELGVNLFYCGHYATETFGVKALAAAVSKKFRIPWEFLDHPTGL